MEKKYTIAVAGTGYVGLSNAILLAQHHKVLAVDIIPEKVELINQRKSPIIDAEIQQYLAEKDLQRWTERQHTARRISLSSPHPPTMTAAKTFSIPLR